MDSTRRDEFMSALVDMGIAERKSTGSEVMLNRRIAFLFFWGALKEAAGRHTNLEERMADLERVVLDKH